MNQKIVETYSELPEVLLYRDRDEAGNEIVQIQAIGCIEGNEDQFAVETIQFVSPITAQGFIRDFSSESASAWCREQEVSI